jgi:hypothetical protein
MTTNKAKKILGVKFKNRTDKEVQMIMDRLKPIVKLAIKETEREFNTSFRDPLEVMSESMGQLDIPINAKYEGFNLPKN